jgi:hypothetical protein
MVIGGGCVILRNEIMANCFVIYSAIFSKARQLVRVSIF